MKKLVYYVSVGNLPKQKALDYIDEVKKLFRDVLDSETSTLGRDFWVIGIRAGSDRIEVLDI